MIYLDNASTTMIAPEVLQTMLPYLQDEYGNAGTLHRLGRKAADAVSKARQQVASVFGCTSKCIVFTSGGSENNNLAIKGASGILKKLGKRHIITTAVEHDSALKALASLAVDGFDVTYVQPSSQGSIQPKLIEREMRDDTGMVVVMRVNNETGIVNDIDCIGKICRERGILFHSDCVQAVGCCEIKTVFTTASVSSHKLHGPKGVGALYIENKEHVSPIIYGGAEQEFGVRGGTENVAGIVGFGKACEMAMKNLRQDLIMVSTLKQRFMSVLGDVIGNLKEAGVHVNGSLTEPGRILSLRISGVSSETLMLMLDAKGVCVSAGSACRAHESEPSHVLLALGLTPDEARSSIRLSFSRYNTQDEVSEVARILASCITILREVKL